MTTKVEPTVEKWEREFDKEFVFQTGDWTELGGQPDHQEFLVEPKEIKDFIRTLLSHSLQEAKAERDRYWLKRISSFERINSLPHDLIAGWKWLKAQIEQSLASLKQEDEK